MEVSSSASAQGLVFVLRAMMAHKSRVHVLVALKASTVSNPHFPIALGSQKLPKNCQSDS